MAFEADWRRLLDAREEGVCTTTFKLLIIAEKDILNSDAGPDDHYKLYVHTGCRVDLPSLIYRST